MRWNAPNHTRKVGRHGIRSFEPLDNQLLTLPISPRWELALWSCPSPPGSTHRPRQEPPTLGRHTECHRVPQWAGDKAGVGPSLVLLRAVVFPSSSRLWLREFPDLGWPQQPRVPAGEAASLCLKRPCFHGAEFCCSLSQARLVQSPRRQHTRTQAQRARPQTPRAPDVCTWLRWHSPGRSYLHTHRRPRCSAHTGAHRSSTSVHTCVGKYCSRTDTHVRAHYCATEILVPTVDMRMRRLPPTFPLLTRMRRLPPSVHC